MKDACHPVQARLPEKAIIIGFTYMNKTGEFVE
jgi:hypothetical protein